MRCITSARFNMKATILRQGDYGGEITVGKYVDRQNPITFEIERVWIEDDSDPVEAGIQQEDFACIARGIVDGGIRVVGTTERITPAGLIQSDDYVRVQCGPNVKISKRDQVWRIRSQNDELLWREEEHDGQPTVFKVMGVTPIFDPFGQMVEQQMLLQRSEVQSVG